MNNTPWRLDPVLLLLVSVMFIFTAIILFVEFKFKDDVQLFQLMGGILTTASGAFFGRLIPEKKIPDAPGTHTEERIATVKITDPPPLPEK